MTFQTRFFDFHGCRITKYVFALIFIYFIIFLKSRVAHKGPKRPRFKVVGLIFFVAWIKIDEASHISRFNSKSHPNASTNNRAMETLIRAIIRISRLKKSILIGRHKIPNRRHLLT